MNVNHYCALYNYPLRKEYIDMFYDHRYKNPYYNMLVKVAKDYRGGNYLDLLEIIGRVALGCSKGIYHGSIPGVTGQDCFKYGVESVMAHLCSLYEKMVKQELSDYFCFHEITEHYG